MSLSLLMLLLETIRPSLLTSIVVDVLAQRTRVLWDAEQYEQQDAAGNLTMIDHNGRAPLHKAGRRMLGIRFGQWSRGRFIWRFSLFDLI